MREQRGVPWGSGDLARPWRLAAVCAINRNNRSMSARRVALTVCARGERGERWQRAPGPPMPKHLGISAVGPLMR